MAHYYEIYRTKSISKVMTYNRVAQVFPNNISIREEDGQLLLVVEGLSDDEIYFTVQCECDRVAFLTGEALDPRFVRKDNLDGSKTASSERKCRTIGFREIPEDIAPQQWNDKLCAQLRLWLLANSLSSELIAVKINMLFQIIEISFPNTRDFKDYKEYKDEDLGIKSDPAPRTEAKFLRHLASHGKKPMDDSQIKRYCTLHQLRPQAYDPTDADLKRLFNNRINVVKEEAERIINLAITRRA